MEKYLKIGDYFGGDVSVSSGARERIVSANGEVLATTPSPQVAKLTAHAINSHDELVAMNKEILAALECAEGFVSEVSEKTGFGQVHTLKVIRSAIAKARAAS